VTASVLREIRLEAFKSFRNAVLPIDTVTVLTGRNNAGKSNALDAIEVLSRLASGEDLADALDGRRREAGPVRGGSHGCTPHGRSEFTLGCTVESDGAKYTLSVTIQTRPELRVVQEKLSGPARALESGRIEIRDLLLSRPPSKSAAYLDAEIYNGKRGTNPVVSFRDSKLLTAQIPLRVSPSTAAERAVILASEAVTTALLAAFHLDPVPQLMRNYVSDRDNDLRRTGENISAALLRLYRQDRSTFLRIRRLLGEVGDNRINGMGITRSGLGDVMFYIREVSGTRRERTPAREMSDGLLRFVAISTALLTANRGLDIDRAITHEGDAPQAGVLLVLEELENGLHPSRAGRMLQLIKEVSAEFSTKVMLTTHSPAMLNAMTGDLNKSVIVCYRDPNSGHSNLSRLPDLPGYAEAMAAGRLGDVVSQGKLVRPEVRENDFTEFDLLLGIEQ
jgi:predicted ATPase